MMVLDSVYERARELTHHDRGRVIFPEHGDARVREAADRLTAEGLAQVVWLPETPVTEAEVAAVLAVRRRTRPEIARRLLEKPLYRAGALLATGQVDVMVAGADSPTRRVIEAASITVGMAPGVTLPSSFFLMLFPGRPALIFADCAVNVAPDTEGLVAIALASAHSAEALLGTARLAMLSFSTGASGTGASVDRVAEAVALLKAEGVSAVGPIQADAALNAGIAAKKGIASGDANVLVFPSLDAGNIAYKLAQELAGAQALGPILQGFAQPVCDLSRGAKVEEIVAATTLTLALTRG
jgi:phosphate acetyltransferase